VGYKWDKPTTLYMAAGVNISIRFFEWVLNETCLYVDNILNLLVPPARIEPAAHGLGIIFFDFL